MLSLAGSGRRPHPWSGPRVTSIPAPERGGAAPARRTLRLQLPRSLRRPGQPAWVFPAHLATIALAAVLYLQMPSFGRRREVRGPVGDQA